MEQSETHAPTAAKPLYVASREYPNIPLTIGAVAAILAIAFYAVDMTFAVVLATVAVAVCGIAWLCCWWYAVAWKRRLAELQQGDCRAHWTINEFHWHKYLDAIKRKANIVLLIMPPAAALPMIGISAGIYESGDLIFGSKFWTFVLPPLGGFAVGAAICGYIDWTIRGRGRRLRKMQGECYLGHRGVYITGMYWPYSSLGFGLVGASASFTNPRVGELVLTFRSQTKHGSRDNVVRIPVPYSSRKEVEEFVQEMS